MPSILVRYIVTISWPPSLDSLQKLKEEEYTRMLGPWKLGRWLASVSKNGKCQDPPTFLGKLPQMENEDLNNNTPAKLSKTSKSESHPRTWSPCHAWTLWSLPRWRGLRFTVTMSPTSSYHSPSHSAVTSSSASSELSGRVKIVICPLPRWVAWIKGTPRIQNRQVVKVKNSRIFRNNLACHCHGVNWCATKVFSSVHLLAVAKVQFGGSRSLRICYTNRSQNDVMMFDKPF